MTKKKVYLALSTALVLIAGYASFRVLHSDAPSPVRSDSAENSSIASVAESERPSAVDVPKPQAKSTPGATVGADESRKLFLKTQNCYFRHQEIALLSNQTDCKGLEGNPALAKQYGECLNNVATALQRISTIRASMTECGPGNAIAKNYYNATKAAAKNGDADAQLCYIRSAFADSDGNMHYTDDDIAQFKADAPRYIADAIARGDWRIVYFLSLKEMGTPVGLIPYIDGARSLERQYRMTSLLFLGADDDYGSTVKVLRDSIPQIGAPAGQELTPEKMATADEWAKNTYGQYFAGTPRLTRSPVVCGSEHE